VECRFGRPGALFCIAPAPADIFAAPHDRLGDNAPAFASALYRAIYPLIVQAALVMLPVP
jgi:hypothetical protein